MITILFAAESWLDSVGKARSEKTRRTYEEAWKNFSRSLVAHDMPPAKTPITKLDHRPLSWLCDDLKRLSPNTEILFLTAVRRFYKFIMAEELTPVNIEKINIIIQMRSRRPDIRLPDFEFETIELFIDRVLKMKISSDPLERLIDLRDRALILTLPDTGLRIHEALNMKRGDINWQEGYAVVIGKGNKQAVVRITKRSQKAMSAYLAARAEADGKTHIQLRDLPIFARHDQGTGKKIRALTTESGRAIVKRRLYQLLSEDERQRVTPHSFRHYFVTVIYKADHDLRLAQALARHSNMETTKRYAHLSDAELDKGYYDIFEKRK